MESDKQNRQKLLDKVGRMIKESLLETCIDSIYGLKEERLAEGL